MLPGFIAVVVGVIAGDSGRRLAGVERHDGNFCPGSLHLRHGSLGGFGHDGRNLQRCDVRWRHSGRAVAHPGTPAAVATTLDGYPLAQARRGGYGLQVALVSSAIGSLASALSLMLLAPPLAKLTLMFGPPEVFWIAIFGLTSIVFLVGGNVTKGLLSACFGVLLSLVGADSITGNDRFTWENLHLLDGINVVVVLVGLYAMPPAISLAGRNVAGS